MLLFGVAGCRGVWFVLNTSFRNTSLRQGNSYQINYALNAFVRGGEVFKSIALSMELIEAEVQPTWDWIALHCLNILQIIIFSFISGELKN